MRKLLPVLTVAASLIAGAALAQPAAAPAAATPAAAAPAAAAPAAAGKLSSKSPLLAVLKDVKAKEVLKKHIPQVVDFVDANGADMIPPEMTIADLTQIAEAGVTPEMVTAIDKDLASL
jgi:hypothetical protein